MDYHHIVFPALQKYYSALKSLDDFGCRGNFFDDVSNLDTFFSEFRNITFVIQKELGTEENKGIYLDLRDKYLAGDTLKWFIETRNSTTKERPFSLKKELEIDLYVPHGIYSLKSKSLLVDLDSSFDEALTIIRGVFMEKLQMVELFFSAKVLFSEEGQKIDLYPRIKAGIEQMNDFLSEFQKRFPCNCATCCSIKAQIAKTYLNVAAKEIKFVNDYTFEKELVRGEQAELYISNSEDAHFSRISEVRATLDNPLYKDAQGCIVDLFKLFASNHIVVYQMQDHEIMPVFMIIYSDNTCRTMPFVATTKATYYRKVQEIANSYDFKDIVAIFYCGEYYTYNPDELSEVNQKPYSERIDLAEYEILSFSMLAKGGAEMTISVDTSKIDDMEYVVEQICNAEWEKDDSPSSLYWLNPIRQKLID